MEIVRSEVSDTDFDVIAYLDAKGHHGRKAGGGREMLYSCFFDCDEQPNSKKRKLSVNVEDGFFQCFVCGAKGGSFLLQKHFGDEPSKGSSDRGFYRRAILDEATATGAQMLRNNDEIMLWLMNERGLDPETIIDRKLGYIDPSWSLTGSLPGRWSMEQLESSGLVHTDKTNMHRWHKDWFYSHVLIPYLHHGHAITLRGRGWNITGAKYISGCGDPVRVFNLDSLEGAEEAIVCEAEMDAIALAQALSQADQERLRRIAVVAIPGAKVVPDELLPALAPLKRVYLGFDSDEAGIKGAESLREKIGVKARVLQLPVKSVGGEEAPCDWSDFLLPRPPQRTSDWQDRHPHAGHTWRDVATLIGSASGKRVFSMAEAGVAWRNGVDRKDWVRTGFKALDAALAPGLLPGQLFVPLAGTGVGKTNLLCNLTYNMRNVPQLVISLEMTRAELYNRLRRIALFHNPAASDFELEAALSNVYICDENRLGEADLSQLAEEFSLETGTDIRVMHVDYLGYFARGFAGNSNYEKTGAAVMGMKAAAKAGGYTIISPSQVNRMAKPGRPLSIADARDAGQVEETSDFLMSLYNPNDALDADDGRPPSGSGLTQRRTGKLRGQLLKSRHGNVGAEFRFQMDLQMLAIVEEGGLLAKRAMNHNEWTERGYTFDDIVKRENVPQQMSLGTASISGASGVSTTNGAGRASLVVKA